MTIGYEGLDIHTFISELKTNDVTTLIDVRELPLSRKKNFSKSALSAAIRNAGIAYLHMPALGCPRDIRKDYRADADWARYRRRFNSYLQTQCAALSELGTTYDSQRGCLMCFEADYEFCHRSLITEALGRDRTITIKHLRAGKPNPAVDPAPARGHPAKRDR